MCIVLTTLVILTGWRGLALEGGRATLPRGGPSGSPQAGEGPRESATQPFRLPGEAEGDVCPFPPQPVRPHQPKAPRPGRAEPRCLLLPPAILVAPIQQVLGGNRRAAGRGCRLRFKWKLPVRRWAGLRRAPWVRPWCSAGTALGDGSGRCHAAVRNARAEARVPVPAAGVAGVPGPGPGRGVVHLVDLNGAMTPPAPASLSSWGRKRSRV